MMRDRSSVALAPRPVVWPPDDTEESVLGTNLHQTAIITLRTGINEAAALATPEGSPALWQAGGQTLVRNHLRKDGSAYTTLPDVFVYLHPWDDARRSLNLPDDGPPALVIEVLSEETYRSDLNLEEGKGYSYARAGVREYLTLDPTYAYSPDGGQGWRLADGVYLPWPRDGAGRWGSMVVPLSFGLEGARAAVYASDGHRFLREGEVERTLRVQEHRLEQEIRERRAAEALAEQTRAELDRLRRRLEELERDR
jgi:hypothetical protein